MSAKFDSDLDGVKVGDKDSSSNDSGIRDDCTFVERNIVSLELELSWVDTLLGSDLVLDGLYSIVRVYRNSDIGTIWESDLNSDSVVVSSNDGVCNDARIKDGLVVIQNYSSLSQGVDISNNTLGVLDSFLDCLNLIVRINFNSELLGSEFDLDVDRVEVCNKSSTSGNTRVGNGLSIDESDTS